MTATTARLPNPGEPVPAVAWPTVSLFFGTALVFAGSTALAVGDMWPVPLSVAINAVCSYLFFTVLHDTCHRSASQYDWVNTWLGRLSAPMVAAPFVSYSVFRFIHMQHHRFTNHDESKDPDAYTMDGPRWTWPIRWATLDLRYLTYYVPRASKRPTAERVEFLVTAAFGIGVIVLCATTGHIGDYLVLYILPTRFAIMFLGFAFDYLPHHGLHATPEEDRYKTTRNRVGMEPVMNAVLLYQNYHLVHHLHPLIPFYRYLAAWRRNEDEYLSHDPALSTVGGRELTADEYREARGLPS
jgi:ring-1,2-phenylacetyl-CoA epoxidase subunit PaaE